MRSTPMQWAYEGKKLDSTVKHLSWLPPWVASPSVDHLQNSYGRLLMGCGDPGHLVSTWEDVPDFVGLGRYPSMWWTLNCKYNAAYDVHRMNAQSGAGPGAIDVTTDNYKQSRFLVARDNPDLVAFMLSLRAELHMRVVMPSVVWHDENFPYMGMARFETNANGHPRWHGFRVGRPGPRMN